MKRAYAFFSAASPLDQQLGGHLIGFASSASFAEDKPPYSIPVTNAWKDASSANDGSYKQRHSLPLRTLYLKEFTPVIAMRGDPGLRLPKKDIGAPRLVTAMTAWFADGYFLLLMRTVLSKNSPDPCADRLATQLTYGLALFRLRANLASNLTANGLYLDDRGRPDAEIFNTKTRTFDKVPNPEELISFSDDKRKSICGPYHNRLSYSGCCANPNHPGSDYLITVSTIAPDLLTPESAIVSADGCSRDISLLAATRPVRRYTLRVEDSNCGKSAPKHVVRVLE
jgi:hypothetical protein